MSPSDEKSRLTCEDLATRDADDISLAIFHFSGSHHMLLPFFFPEHRVWQGSKQVGHLLIGYVVESPHMKQISAAGLIPEKQV